MRAQPGADAGHIVRITRQIALQHAIFNDRAPHEQDKGDRGDEGQIYAVPLVTAASRTRDAGRYQGRRVGPRPRYAYLNSFHQSGLKNLLDVG